MKRKTKVERLIVASAIAGGLSKTEIDVLLVEAGFDVLNDNSYSMMRSGEVVEAIFNPNHPYDLRTHINRPHTLGDIVNERIDIVTENKEN